MERANLIRVKNKTFQSCLYCSEGGAKYMCVNENGDVFYVCNKHKNDHYKDKTIDAIPEPEFLTP